MRLRRRFLALIVMQTLHSVEEYAFRLYDDFPPARFLSGLVSSDLQRGFLILNIALIAFAFWCYFFPVRREWQSSTLFLGLWIAIESMNGIVHPAWSLFQQRYTPGTVTALVLLPLALLVAAALRDRGSRSTTAVERG